MQLNFKREIACAFMPLFVDTYTEGSLQVYRMSIPHICEPASSSRGGVGKERNMKLEPRLKQLSQTTMLPKLLFSAGDKAFTQNNDAMYVCCCTGCDVSIRRKNLTCCLLKNKHWRPNVGRSIYILITSFHVKNSS